MFELVWTTRACNTKQGAIIHKQKFCTGKTAELEDWNKNGRNLKGFLRLSI